MYPFKSAISGVRHLYIVDLPSSRNLDENGRLRSGGKLASVSSSRLQVCVQTVLDKVDVVFIFVAFRLPCKL